MLLIGVVILVFVGPDRIPELMSTAGRYYGKFRRMSDDLRRAFNAEVARAESDRRREELDARRKAEMKKKQEREEAARTGEQVEGAVSAEPGADPTAPLAPESDGVTTPEPPDVADFGEPDAVASSVPAAPPPAARPPGPREPALPRGVAARPAWPPRSEE